MTKQEKKEQNWTLGQYVAYLRLSSAEWREGEIDIVTCLMRLEKKTHLWKMWGLETFAQGLNDLKYLGLDISPVRYGNVKQAILDFGEAKVRKWGLCASRYAGKLHGPDRAQFVQRVEEKAERYQRPLSKQSVHNVYHEVAPPPLRTRPTNPDAVKVQKLEGEIARLQEHAKSDVERLQQQIRIWRAVVDAVKAWHTANNIGGFNWSKAMRDARAASG